MKWKANLTIKFHEPYKIGSEIVHTVSLTIPSIETNSEFEEDALEEIKENALIYFNSQFNLSQLPGIEQTLSVEVYYDQEQLTRETFRVMVPADILDDLFMGINTKDQSVRYEENEVYEDKLASSIQIGLVAVEE